MGETALITGASAGLGLELAKLFARDKSDVVLVARRREKLDELAATLAKEHGVKAHVLPADLTDRAAPKQLLDQVAALGIEVDVLVNNAGFGSNGPFVELDPKRELDMVEVNVTALVHLTRLFLPGMVARKRGHVVNVGSTAGFVPGPYMATYFATKAFVLSFTEALAHEVRGTGVRATVFCPGATATEFAALAGNDSSKLFQGSVPDAASVAREGYRLVRKGRVIAIPGLMNRLNAFAPRFAPRGFVRLIAGRLNRP